MFRDIKLNKKFFFLTVFILFISFAFNAFGALSTEKFIYDFRDSESLVYNQILCPDYVYNDQLLNVKQGYKEQLKECREADLVAYSSQYGLQGKIYDSFADLLAEWGLGPVWFLSLANLFTALVSAMVIGLIVLWFRVNFGIFVGYFITFALAMSPIIVGFSKNLYWALPLLFAPLVYLLYFYKQKATVSYKTRFFLGLCILLIARFLCGYEYASTITIMLLAIVGYFLYINNAKLASYLKTFTLLSIVSIVSFFLAMTIHVVSLNGFSGSTKNSIQIIRERASERTHNSDQYLNYAFDGTKNSLNDHYVITDNYLHYDVIKEKKSTFLAIVFSLVNYAFLPVYNVPFEFRQPFATYVQSTLLFIIVLGFIYFQRKKLFDKNQIKSINALFLSFSIGLIGSFSWFLLANSHSLVHAHINGILFYLPSALFGFVIIAIVIQNYGLKLKKKYE